MGHGSLRFLHRFAESLFQLGRISAAVTSVLACAVLAGCGAPTNSTAEGGSFEAQKDDVGAIARKVGEVRETETINALAITPDGEHVAVKTVASPTIHIWGWRGSSHIERTLTVPSSPKLYLATPILKYSPAGHRLAILDQITGIADQATAIHFWDSDSGRFLRSIGEPNNFPSTYGLAFSEDHSVLSLYHPRVESPEHDLVSFRSDTWTPEWRLTLGPLIPSSLTTSPNGQLAAIGASTLQSVVNPHRPIVIVNLSTHAILREIAAFPNQTVFSRIAWSPDGKQIAAGVSVESGYPDIDSLKIFDVATGDRTSHAIPPQQNVADLAYGGEGKYLVVSTAGLVNAITIWDNSLKSILQTIPLKSGLGRPIAASGDGRFIAVADDVTVGIWELK
jgi:WD40 repeat protein